MTSSLYWCVTGTLALIASVGFSNESLAQNSPFTCNLDEKVAYVEANPSSAVTSFREMLTDDGCFTLTPRLGEPCQTSEETDPLCKDIMAWQEQKKEAKEEGRPLSQDEAALDIGFDLLARIQTQSAALETRTNARLSAKATLFSESLETIDPLSSDNFRDALRRADTQIWLPDTEGRLFGPDGIVPSEVLSKACADTADNSNECGRTFVDLATLYTLAAFQHTMMSTFFEEDRAAVDDYLTGLDQRWSTYLTQSRGILPWELYANGLLFKPERGFNEPPSAQLILLHPNTSLGVGDRDGGDLDAVLALELIGYYDWRWEGGEMKAPFKLPGFLDDYPLGGSLIVGFDGDDDPGFGGIVHLPRNWSVGAMVDTDGDVTALLSVDIAKLEFFTGDAASLRRGLVSLFKGL